MAEKRKMTMPGKIAFFGMAVLVGLLAAYFDIGIFSADGSIVISIGQFLFGAAVGGLIGGIIAHIAGWTEVQND